ncbi:MAG: hypothetical protein JRJ47_14360, partial [Deltaproteobacteria bacterium]|nr:hypothetical protein [Deltaproteobacteria bacterium]
MTSLKISEMFFSVRYCLLFAFLLLMSTGCGAMRRAQVRSVARVLSGPSETNVFVEDDDPELIRDALPFALKTYETLLASDPKNKDLFLTTAAGFVTYANAFVQTDAEESEEFDFRLSQRLRKRAAKLYLRGR